MIATDKDLIVGVVTGDESAFVALYRRWRTPIYRFALRISGSECVAEDATQEVFMTLIRDAARYDSERGSVSAYLYGIARNQVLRVLRANRRVSADLQEISDADLEAPGMAPPEDPLNTLERSEVAGSIRQAILSLPLHYREVVALCDLDGKSYAEAAEILDCAVGTIRSRLHRAHSILLDKLQRADETATLVRKIKTTRCLA